MESPTTHLYMPDTEEILSLALSLSSVTVMALLFGRKTSRLTFDTINYPRSLVILLHFDTWALAFSAGLLVLTNSLSIISCQVTSLLCIFFYAVSKMLIYLFLIERVHIVTGFGVTRWSSSMFKFNILLLTPYIGILALCIIYRNAYIDAGGLCRLSLTKESSIPLLVYDTFVSSWLTLLFVRSLISSTSMLQGATRTKLREVAKRAMIGSIIALFLSSANISYYLIDPQERGLLCLALCIVDVTLNACTIHWITSRSDSSSSKQNVDKQYLVGERARVGSGGRPVAVSTGGKNQLSQLKSHISVSIESYVEEYHQMHISPTPL